MPATHNQLHFCALFTRFSGSLFVLIAVLNNGNMKSIGMLSVVAMLVSGCIISYGQEIETEVPGNNFSLEGALELFKRSESPEEFEKLLNSSDSKVNNLDLNGDGYIDYIRVFDKYEGNVHAFIIQAVVSETENQDVAVIELEKLANGKAVLQIIGDEDVYGIETIIEPSRQVRTYAGTTFSQTVVNVWAWPSVQYIYGPYYDGWSSPWGYYHRPVWYHTWRPIAYYHYDPIWRPYRSYYATCYTRRVEYAHHIYSPYRTTSVFVRNRHHDQVERYRSARQDDDRNGRTRDNERRSYGNIDRSSNGNEHQRRRGDSDFNRRSSAQREAFTSPRSTSREQNLPADMQRNSSGKREDFLNRRSGAANNNEERRQQLTRPTTADRNRSFESLNGQQGSTINERNLPADMQRNSSGKREDFLNRRSGTVNNNGEIRQQVTRPSANRNRSMESPNVQPRSTTRERSMPTDIQRNSSGIRSDDFSNRRSGTVYNNRETPQQVSRPTVDRNRSIESSNVQQRPANRTGVTRSKETKRGRH